MSSDAFYSIFQLDGYTVTHSMAGEELLYLELAPEQQHLRCPGCRSRNVVRSGSQPRLLHHLPVGGQAVRLNVFVPRVKCHACGTIRQVKFDLADTRRTYTFAFERYVLELSQHMTIQAVANHLGVSWDIVKDIQKRHLRKHYARPSLKKVKQIAIDEICIGHPRKFLTIVLDLDSGAILFVGKGRNAASLAPFWRRLRKAGAKVQAVATDMSKAYISAVEKNLPDAALVFDRFHVVKLMNSKLTKLRRELFHELANKQQRQVLKGTRWLLLMNPENLDSLKDEPRRLQEALRLNEPLATAYYLKEDLRQFWEQPDKEIARRKMQSWYHQAMSSGVRTLQEFARFLLGHQERILAWYDYPISTGPLEGTNNKIKTMLRQHYGLRDQEFFRLKLYQLHETMYALVG
jgi:transposase